MATVYVVTSGSYSGYCIVAVFSDEETANRYCENKNPPGYAPDYRVEEYELDKAEEVDFAKKSEPHFLVTIEGTKYRRPGYSYAVRIMRLPESNTDLHEDKYERDGTFITLVHTDDKDRAIKVAQERLMQHKARLAGIG